MDKNIDIKFEEKWKCSDIQNIMFKVTNGYRSKIHDDDIESVKMETLWKCLLKFDGSRGSKFTSYLYQQLSYAMKNLWKIESRYNAAYSNEPVKAEDQNKQAKPVKNNAESIGIENQKDVNMENHMECLDIITGLKDEHHQILSQRFYRNMTMKEIGRANGYSRETARRKLKNAIKYCKQSSL